jgi:hypothetical protein
VRACKNPVKATTCPYYCGGTIAIAVALGLT